MFDKSGRLLKRISKDGGPHKIPAREMAFIKEHYQPFPGTTWKDVSAYYPFFCGTDLDDRGRLIVRTHVFLSDSRDFFDVFSPDGQYLANVSMKHTLWRLWANGRLYAIEDDPEGLPVIKICRGRSKSEILSQSRRDARLKALQVCGWLTIVPVRV